MPPATATLPPPATLTPLPTATASLTPTPQPSHTPTPTTVPHVSLSFVGDVMLDRALGDQIRWGRPEYPFAYTADLLAAADYTVANFEAALGAIGYPQPKAYTFRAPAGAVASLQLAGIDLVSLANNHALDFGADGLAEGMRLLDEGAVAHVGAGPDESSARTPEVVIVEGVALAFLSYVDVPVEWQGFDTGTWRAREDRPGVAWAVPELIAADVMAIRPKVDHVIVLIHAGTEGNPTPNAAQLAASDAAVAAGARLVVHHHSHVLQGVEQVDEALIFYGLGNFAFPFDDVPQDSVILNVELDLDRILSWELVPIVVETDGRPRLADSAESERIRSQIDAATDLIPSR